MKFRNSKFEIRNSGSRPGNAIIAIVIAVLALIFFAFAIVYYAVFGQLFNMDKPTGASGPSYGTGCYLEDQYFTDTSIADEPEKVIATLAKNTRYGPPAAKVKSNILDILSEGKKQGLNPAIVIGMWWGEQEFADPHKAFGYGYTDSGPLPGVGEGWPYQLRKVWTPLKSTIAVTGAYKTPDRANRMTRLFYHYASAMGLQYRESGQRWDRNYKHTNHGNPYYKRLDVIKLLVPDQVTCESGSASEVVNTVK